MAFLLSELADEFRLELIGDPHVSIERVAGLEMAGPADISFYTGGRHLHALRQSRAGAVILGRQDAERFPGNKLISDNPHASFARIAQRLHPRQDLATGIDAAARLADDVILGNDVGIGPGVVIEQGVEIEAGCQIGAGTYIGRDVRIGAGTIVFPNATILHRTIIGRQCLIYSGAVIGADGFGHARDGAEWIPVPQLGRVRLGDRVSIGANTTIDRGAIGDTVLGDGVKLDNLIHIAHNVRVGDNTAMAAGCGIAGSTRIGRRCTFAGQVGVADNLEICDDAHFTGRAVVLKSVTRPGVYSSGILLDETGKWRRNALRFNQLDALFRQVRGLLKGADNKPG